MEKRWKILKQAESKKVEDLSKALNINKTLANLLILRGINTFEEAKSFFRPSLDDLHDPFLMKDMGAAIERIEKAIQNEEKILIYGDYDVDGTTAVALVFTYFGSFYHNLGYYVPDRYDEGYGISTKSIDFAKEQGYSLIIALDCGIKAVEKIEYASSLNIDFIIADHHRPDDILPNAVAVLDPKRADCDYPFDELSGCGVGFKIIQAYNSKNNLPFSNLKQYLDLVTVSIAADIVEITGENRILAYYGLRLINKKPRPGIEAILKYSGVGRIAMGDKKDYAFDKKLSISDLVFMVGPRINAAGRIESAHNSVKLLISKNIEEASEVAAQINEFNKERKDLDTNITRDASDKISRDPDLLHRKTTVVFDPSWHKGVIGIVASRLVETFYRPTIVFTQSNGLITGSARSVKDYDIYEAIASCSDLLENFGGHKYAAGLSLTPDKLDVFIARFENFVSETIHDEMLTPEIEIDAEICVNDITKKFYNVLKQFAPFGPGNMSPVFVTRNLIDTGYARIVGKNHLKFEVVHPNIRGYPIAAIAFQQKEHLTHVLNGNTFNICYYITENTWNGRTTLQLNIKDIKPYINEY